MRKSTCVYGLLAAVLASIVLPSSALAEAFHFRGDTAYGNFYGYDPTGCIATNFYVFATESRSHSSGGAATSGAWANIGIYQYNECTYETLACLYGSMPISSGDFSMAGNLSAATLNATFEALDCSSGEPQPVSVAITWTGVGDVVRGMSSSSYSLPGYHSSSHYSGQSRYAELSGSLTFGDTTVDVADNLYGSGTLSVTSSGSAYTSR
jgi:hypothetical protein